MRDLEHFNYIDVVRCFYTDKSIIGKMYVNDIFKCYTLEPLGMQIPIGEYDLSLNVVSPKYRFKYPYRLYCHGKVPRLVGVPDRSGILIHIGNTAKDSRGCILVGQKWFRTNPDKILCSTRAFIDFYSQIKTFKYPIKVCVSALSE